jgi:hypothetical protein
MMSEPTLPDQETATLALMMNREVDKRVVLAVHRGLFPSNGWREKEIERAYDTQNYAEIQKLVQGMFVEAILSDGSLMHQIRSKIGEHMQRY